MDIFLFFKIFIIIFFSIALQPVMSNGYIHNLCRNANAVSARSTALRLADLCVKLLLYLLTDLSTMDTDHSIGGTMNQTVPCAHYVQKCFTLVNGLTERF
jgi:hypothetical protein